MSSRSIGKFKTVAAKVPRITVARYARGADIMVDARPVGGINGRTRTLIKWLLLQTPWVGRLEWSRDELFIGHVRGDVANRTAAALYDILTDSDLPEWMKTSLEFLP